VEWLDVDVRCALFGRPGDDLVYKADNGSLAREVLELLDVEFDGIVVSRGKIADRLSARDDLAIIEAIDGRLELRRYSDTRYDLASRDHADGVDRVFIDRVGHGHDDTLVALGQRQNPGIPQEARADLTLVKRQRRIVARADHGQL